MVKPPVVILAGGRGARFDHESQVLPKPLIEVAGKPIIEHIVDSLADQGFQNFIIATGHLHQKIDAWVISQAADAFSFASYYGPKTWSRRKDGTSITAVHTGDMSTTAERLVDLSVRGLDQRFILTYGDGLSDVKMDDVIALHESPSPKDHVLSDGHVHPASASPPLVTLTSVLAPGRFGVIDVTPAPGYYGLGYVRQFREKTHELINGGFMVVESEFITRYLSGPGVLQKLEDEALPAAAAEWRVRTYRHYGYWRCMDTRRDLEQIEADVAANGGVLPWRHHGDDGRAAEEGEEADP